MNHCLHLAWAILLNGLFLRKQIRPANLIALKFPWWSLECLSCFKTVWFLWTCSSCRQIWPPKGTSAISTHANWLPWHMELLDSARWYHVSQSGNSKDGRSMVHPGGFCHMSHPMEMCESCETKLAEPLSSHLFGLCLPNQNEGIQWKHLHRNPPSTIDFAS